jgi:hypothetical protein
MSDSEPKVPMPVENKKYNYSKVYSKNYYQNNKDKFKLYYQNYKLKKQQIANGTYIPPVKAKPAKSNFQRTTDKFAKIQRAYEKRRAKWLLENQHLFDKEIIN